VIYGDFFRKYREKHPQSPEEPEEKREGKVVPFHSPVEQQQFGGDGDNQSQTPQQMH